MSTTRYSRFVVINEDAGTIVWYETLSSAEKCQKDNGGTLYDFDSDDRITIENALRSARQRMGVE